LLNFGPRKKGEAHLLSTLRLEGAREILVAAAFASEAGVRELVAGIDLFAAADVRKRWLIGLENGLTQPEALEAILDLEQSEVRVPYGSEIPETPGFHGNQFFHPKIYAAASSSEAVLISTSANLTRGGLRDNIEQALTWRGAPGDPQFRDMTKWWRRMWGGATPVDSDFIEGYALVRPKLQLPPAGTDEPLEEAEPAPTDLSRASWMWVEATRPMEGGANNQFELMLDAHHFFYPDGEPDKDVKRRLYFEDRDGHVYEKDSRVIHFNGPPLMPKGNWMWRIRLPTEHEGLTGYQHGGVSIRFIRADKPDHYKIKIAEIGSPEAERWFHESAKRAEVAGPPPRRMGWA